MSDWGCGRFRRVSRPDDQSMVLRRAIESVGVHPARMKSREVMDALALAIPGLLTKGFRRAVRALASSWDGDSMEAAESCLDMVPDGYAVYEDEKLFVVYEVEDHSRLTLKKLFSYETLQDVLEGQGWEFLLMSYDTTGSPRVVHLELGLLLRESEALKASA